MAEPGRFPLKAPAIRAARAQGVLLLPALFQGVSGDWWFRAVSGSMRREIPEGGAGVRERPALRGYLPPP
jgi:hypothetical protein